MPIITKITNTKCTVIPQVQTGGVFTPEAPEAAESGGHRRSEAAAEPATGGAV